MEYNKDKEFGRYDIKFGLVKKFCGTKRGTIIWDFSSYIIYYKDNNGKCVNVCNENEKFEELVMKNFNIINYENGVTLVEQLSDSADFVMCRLYDVSKKKSYTTREIENAILALDSLYFKDAQEIKDRIEKEEQIQMSEKKGFKRKIKIRK